MSVVTESHVRLTKKYVNIGGLARPVVGGKFKRRATAVPPLRPQGGNQTFKHYPPGQLSLVVFLHLSLVASSDLKDGASPLPWKALLFSLVMVIEPST
jgi:hypothetical protein